MLTRSAGLSANHQLKMAFMYPDPGLLLADSLVSTADAEGTRGTVPEEFGSKQRGNLPLCAFKNKLCLSYESRNLCINIICICVYFIYIHYFYENTDLYKGNNSAG